MRLKTARDLIGIWRSGQVASRLHHELREMLKPGVTTAALDAFARRFIAQHDATPAFLGYRGYPAALCISINDEIVHGIPGERRIKQGELVSIDLGVTLDNYISDTAWSWWITAGGPADSFQQMEPAAGRLCQGTLAGLRAGIAAVATDQPIRKLSRAIEEKLRGSQLGVIRDLTGHGVGFDLHEEPTIHNFDTGARGPILRPGAVLAIEPMATLGSEEILLGADNWTYRTADGSLAAHFEHTVALWDKQTFVLTDHLNDIAAQAFGGSA
jgi:methionyl aminopeptidase